MQPRPSSLQFTAQLLGLEERPLMQCLMLQKKLPHPDFVSFVKDFSHKSERIRLFNFVRREEKLFSSIALQSRKMYHLAGSKEILYTTNRSSVHDSKNIYQELP